MIEDFLWASGNRIMAGRKGPVYHGSGNIFFERAPKIGIDSNLWACLKVAVDQTGLTIQVNSIDTGQHVPGSRHYEGRAVDINIVVKAGNNLGTPNANLANAEAAKFVDWLLAHGFKVGEGKPQPAILWGPVGFHLNPSKVDHSTHLHVSLGKRRAPVATPRVPTTRA